MLARRARAAQPRRDQPANAGSQQVGPAFRLLLSSAGALGQQESWGLVRACAWYRTARRPPAAAAAPAAPWRARYSAECTRRATCPHP